MVSSHSELQDRASQLAENLQDLMQIWIVQALLALPSSLFRTRQERSFWTPSGALPICVPESMKGWELLFSLAVSIDDQTYNNG